VLHGVRGEATDALEALGGRDVPVAAFAQLGEDPGLDERAAGDHDGVDARGLDLLVEGAVVIGVAVADKGDPREIVVLGGGTEGGDALADVVVVGGLAVALLTRATVQCDARDAPFADAWDKLVRDVLLVAVRR
jgi:hypothetical protein